METQNITVKLDKIRTNIFNEISIVSKSVPVLPTRSELTKIRAMTKHYLTKILSRPDLDFILNQTKLRLSEDEANPEIVAKKMKIGIYPISANPLHWAHLLIGLSAMARLDLHKIVFVIAGEDRRKPGMIPAIFRHQAAKEVLESFSPFFAYSSVAKESNFDGETNMFRLLNLNPNQKIETSYIVGSDHYYKTNPVSGRPDTLLKLENNMGEKIYGYNRQMHSIQTIFINRGKLDRKEDTKLKVTFIPAMPFAASSTMIRETISKGTEMERLAILPFTAFKHIQKFGLYGFMPAKELSANV